MNSIQGNGSTLHVVGECVNRIGKVWSSKPADRFYPLENLKRLTEMAVKFEAPLLMIEGDIVLDDENVEQIRRLKGNHMFLYHETNPTHADAYERLRTMSCLLQPETVHALKETLAQFSEAELRSISICQPVVLYGLTRVPTNNQIRLTHATHDAEKPATENMLRKVNNKLTIDEERQFQKSLANSLARTYGPVYSRIIMRNALDRLHDAGIKNIGVYGDKTHTLQCSEVIEEASGVKVIIDDERSQSIRDFCGKPVRPLMQAMTEYDLQAVVMSAGKYELEKAAAIPESALNPDIPDGC